MVAAFTPAPPRSFIMDSLFVSNTCPHCHVVRSYLDSHPAAAAAITIRNTSTDQSALDELARNGVLKIPLLVTDRAEPRGGIRQFLGPQDILKVLKRRFGE